MPNTSTITNNLKILHIEDDVDYREDWDMVLSEHFPGCVITGKSSAEAAITLIENGYSPDIIILDMQLAGTMRGMDFLRWLREVHGISDSMMPVFVLSVTMNAAEQVQLTRIQPGIVVLFKYTHTPEEPDFVYHLIDELTSDVATYTICGEDFKDYLAQGKIVFRRHNLGLTPSEYGILQKLLKSHPTPTSSANLAINLDIAPGSIPVHIHGIKEKIASAYENHNQSVQIRNSTGFGYYIGELNQ